MEELAEQLSLFNWADHSQSYNIIYWALTDHVDNSYANKEEYKKEKAADAAFSARIKEELKKRQAGEENIYDQLVEEKRKRKA